MMVAACLVGFRGGGVAADGAVESSSSCGSTRVQG